MLTLNSLQQSLANVREFEQKDSFEIPSGNYPPSFWLALLTANFGKDYKVNLGSDSLKTFANTIGFNNYARSCERIPVTRPNENKSYTKIQKIDMIDSSVETANSGILSCFRESFKTTNRDYLIGTDYFGRVQKTIGELHDNVRSHSRSVGFSMAQFLNNQFEFSISDTGIGFLEEIRMSRVAPSIKTDNEAIRWCLEKGNSTKKISDEFTQALPPDFIGHNPMGSIPIALQRANGNHHQGLGLDILRQFALNYRGILEIASGLGFYQLDAKGEIYSENSTKNNGVFISLRFNLSEIDGRIEKDKKISEIHESIKWSKKDE